MRNFMLLSMIFWLCLPLLSAQDQELQAEEESLGLFSDVKVTKVRLLSETEQSLHLEVTYESDNSKKYAVYGQILDPRRSSLDILNGEAVEIVHPQGSFDLNFYLDPGLDAARYQQPYLASAFVKIIFTETNEQDSSWGDILKDLGADNPLNEALGESFLFRYQKQWRIGGSSGMIIEVPIQPIGRAGSVRRQ